jgi:succinate dehydrogenase / fumarate reductase iron-sulfur subunit
MSDTRIFEIYRYDPDVDKAPRMETYELELKGERMLLDALISLKKIDESITYRRSCREGVCGSDEHQWEERSSVPNQYALIA